LIGQERLVKIEGRLKFFRNALSLTALASLVPAAGAAQTTQPSGGARKQFIKNAHAQSSAYSQGIVTAPGRTVWLAGQTGAVTADGKPILDFEGQVREIFRLFSLTLAEGNAKLSDIVYMTVFLKDVRYMRTFTDIRKELLVDNFPVSAVITITALATPVTLIEVQAIAVVN
jgi:2-iminobutanoate/2-iminopropanoate deaminase